MKKHILAQTNIFVCSMIIVGFLLTSYISYTSNVQFLEKDITNVTKLASRGIFYRINLLFAEPIAVSLAMANSNLLRDFLTTENSHGDNSQFVDRMREYLCAYQKKYNYHSVFFVSTQTNKYYHYSGVDRKITLDNPQNKWFYDFINNSLEYSLNVDDDEVGDKEVTVFINTKIRDENGIVLGVVGVGFRVSYLQNMLKKYEEEFSMQASLINKGGVIEISQRRTYLENILWVNDIQADVPLKKVFAKNTTPTIFWVTSPSDKIYIAACYIPTLDWYLIVENNTDSLTAHFNTQAMHNLFIIIFIILVVLFTITSVINKYNAKIVRLTAQQHRAHYADRQKTIKNIYKNIYEFDITNNCAANRRTKNYFESLGFSGDTPYDSALCRIAEKLIAQDFRTDYITTLASDHVLQAYAMGLKSLSFDFMTRSAKNSHWQRIVACIYYVSDKQSLRLSTYCYSIEEDKNNQHAIIAQMQRDPLTGLCTKAVTEEMIDEKLARSEQCDPYAFILLNMDNCRNINSESGYEVGDFILTTFAQNLQEQFHEDTIVGRMGGDEFVAFMPVLSLNSLEQKLKSLVKALHKTQSEDHWNHTITVSIGVALAPAHGNTFDTLFENADTALSHTKAKGKNGYTIFSPTPAA